MFINPQKAFKEGWITGVKDEAQIQPNAIDITADRLFAVNPSNHFSISKTDKLHRNRTEFVNPTIWSLERGVYDVMSDCYVEMPEGVAGYLITRSTLNRNGVFVQSGLYDSGYKGPVQFMLYNLFGRTELSPHVCVAQFVFVESESSGKYSGGYNTEKGELPTYMAFTDRDRKRWAG